MFLSISISLCVLISSETRQVWRPVRAIRCGFGRRVERGRKRRFFRQLVRLHFRYGEEDDAILVVSYSVFGVLVFLSQSLLTSSARE
jgi:hypothetical protein